MGRGGRLGYRIGVSRGPQVRRPARARACRAAPRSLGGCSLRSRAPSRSERGAAGASRCGHSRRVRRGSARMPRPRQGAEGGHASAVPTRSRDPYQIDGSGETPRREVALALCGELSSGPCLQRGPATAPRTPVASRPHEVASGRDRLLARRAPVAEQTPLVRAHLEEPEVLPVLGCRAELGLAPGDCDRLVTVRAKDVADGRSGGRRGESASVPRRNGAPESSHGPCEGACASLRMCEGGRGALGVARAHERPVRVEEADGAAIPVEGCELALESLVQGPCLTHRRIRLRRSGGRACLDRRRSGLRHENQREQADE